MSGVEQPVRGGGAYAGDGVGRGKAEEHRGGLCGREELAALPQLHHRPRHSGSCHRRARICIGRAVGQRSRREHARAGREDVHARSVVGVRCEGVGGCGGTHGDRVGRARWRGRARVALRIARRDDDHHAGSVRGRDGSILGRAIATTEREGGHGGGGAPGGRIIDRPLERCDHVARVPRA